jgi:hypothetical protein
MPANEAGIAGRLDAPGNATVASVGAATTNPQTTRVDKASAVPLSRYAPGVLLLAIAIAAAGQQVDPDLWGHVRFGQTVLSQHRLMFYDSYSYSAPGHLFLNHEWLSDIVMAFLYNHLGVVGLKLWKFGCAAATILLLAAGMAETGATPSVRMNTLIAAAVALMPQMQFRPQIFTFCLFAAILLLLARHNYRGAGPLWLAVPLMALWANLHGGFIIGLAALGIYTGVVGIGDLIAGAGIARALRAGLVTIAAAAATLLTPYGLGIWESVLHALRNPFTRNVVTDWQPMLFAIVRQWNAGHLGVVYYLCVIGLIAAMAITFARTPRGGDLPLVTIAALMSAAAFTAVRNMPLAVIACAGPIARHAWLISRRTRDRKAGIAGESSGVPAHSGVNQWLAGALAMMVAVSSGMFSALIAVGRDYPAGAVAFMHRRGLRGNLLGAFGWGDYLIWHMAPDSKVFFDGRYDTVYPQRIIRDYVVFYFDLPGGARVLSEYPHDFVLIPPNSMANGLMRRTPGWKAIYRDAASVLYARVNQPAESQAGGGPETGSTPRRQYFP